MHTKMSITMYVLFLSLASSVTAQPKVFDITTYGGKPNEDITQAVTNAWKEACASETPSKVVVPKGTFKMNAVELKGPCKASIELQVEAIIQAPPDPAQLNDADQWVRFEKLNSFILSGGGTFDGQGASAWKKNNCAQDKYCKKASMNFGFMYVENSIAQDITSKDSKHFHVTLSNCNNLTFDRFTVSAPPDSVNSDGIHIARSTLVTVKNSNIGTGDDCVSLGSASKQVTVENVTCGPGHGISVGSLGKHPNEEAVDGVTVRNCTIKETTNGVRIKTWLGAPGAITISNVNYENIIMNNVKNPVLIDQEYCPFDQCESKNPSKIKISKVTFKNIKGTSVTQEGIILACSKDFPCEGVELNDIDLTFNGAPATAKCANVKPTIQGKAPTCAA